MFASRTFSVAMLACLFLSLFFFGCAEDPSPTGVSLLPGGDSPLFRVDTVFANHDSTSRLYLNSLLFSKQLLVGSYQGYEAWSCIKFNIGRVPDSLTGLPIVGAFIELHPALTLGSASTPIAIQVYRLIQFSFVSTDSVTLDSLKLFPATYYDALEGSLASTTANETDSLRIPISDTTGIRASTEGSAGTTLFEGFLLKPNFTGSIRGFGSSLASANLLPRLVVQYLHNGVRQEYYFNATATRFIADSKPGPTKIGASMIVQNGISYRPIFDFDLSPLPQSTSVMKATLQLSLDAANSSAVSSSTVDSVVVYLMYDNGALEQRSMSIYTPRISNSGRPVYSVSITEFVQLWMRPSTVLRRIVVAGLDEYNSLDRFAIYGSGAARSLQPRIIVTNSPAR
ncbi:MAG: hypothetical protein HY966_01530 [Ignavibacteriales bacterium]|nr:hypothetical protein [Ignavibacteriales bacterium]